MSVPLNTSQQNGKNAVSIGEHDLVHWCQQIWSCPQENVVVVVMAELKSDIFVRVIPHVVQTFPFNKSFSKFNIVQSWLCKNCSFFCRI